MSIIICCLDNTNQRLPIKTKSWTKLNADSFTLKLWTTKYKVQKSARDNTNPASAVVNHRWLLFLHNLSNNTKPKFKLIKHRLRFKNERISHHFINWTTALRKFGFHKIKRPSISEIICSSKFNYVLRLRKQRLNPKYSHFRQKVQLLSVGV